MQFLQRSAQILIVLGLNGIHAREDHRFGFLETVNGFVAGARYMGDGVAHFHFRGSFDARYNITYIAGGNLLARGHVEFENTYLVRVVLLAGVDEAHLVARLHRAVHHLEISDDTAEGVENRVKNQTLQRRFRVAFRRRDALHDGV